MWRLHSHIVRASLTVGLIASSAGAQPVNDGCAGALPAGVGAVQGSTASATPNGTSTCGLSNTTPDVYYRFTAPATCQFEVLTCDGATDYDTVISIHSACPATTSNQIVCSNDACGSRSRALLNGVAGTSYIIRVAGFQGDFGAFTLIIRQLGRPANDTCAGAQQIVGVTGSITGDTSCAMSEGSQACGQDDSTGSPNLYYVWTAPAHGVVTFDTCGGASFRTFLSASTHCPHTSLNLVGCNTPACEGGSITQFGVVAGASYSIRVGGLNNERGAFTLAWTFEPTQFAPNDGCAGAQPISLGTVSGTTVGASIHLGGSCFLPQNSNDVFYRFRSPVEAFVTIDTCHQGTNFDTTLAIYSGCPATDANRIACSDNAGCGLFASLTFPARPGVDYIVRLAGAGNASGNYVLRAHAEVDAIVFDPSTLGEYYLMGDNRSIFDFREYADLMGAHMATLTSFSEAQFVNKSVIQSGNVMRSAAFGLSDELIEGVLRWDTDETVYFTYFLQGQPDNFNGGEDYCHVLDPVSGVWNDYPGLFPVPTLYGVAESGAALLRTELNPANGHYYAVFEASSWQGAKARARAMGGNLVTINDAQENEWVHDTFVDAAGGHDLWIGLSDAVAEGILTWADGSDSTYSNFAPGEPNNLGSNEDYIELLASTGQWNDIPNLQVGNPNHGVAEFVMPEVIGVAHGPGGCGTYALLSASSLYPAAFAGSELGASLISIHSAEENEFIRSAFAAPNGGRRIWIIGSDAADEGNFRWLDRTDFNYSNFAPGEPDSAGGNQDYLVMNPNGTWSDVSTLDAGPFFGVIRLYCSCDWNASGTRTSQDFFDFLTSFFADQADINCDHITNSQDFFDFLACFFSGCEA